MPPMENARLNAPALTRLGRKPNQQGQEMAEDARGLIIPAHRGLRIVR